MATLKDKNGKTKQFIYECTFRQNSTQHQQYLKDLIYKTFHQRLDVVEIVVQSHATKSDTKKWLKKDLDLYFGVHQWKKLESNAIEFQRVISETVLILVTNNVKFFEKSGKYALMIAKDKCVWLKDWQIKGCYNFWTEEKMYIVKLNKQYFTPYQLNFSLNDIQIQQEQTWDDLWEEARRQEAENRAWCLE